MNVVYNEPFGLQSVQRAEHGFPMAGPIAPDSWLAGSIVELARITVPKAVIGKITRIDTLVIDATTGNPIADWTNPDSFDDVFLFGITHNPIDSYRYKLQLARVVSFAASPVAWPRLAGANPLISMPQWDDYRYAWGNPSNAVDVPVFEQSVIRLWVYCREDTEYLHTVKGKLVIEWSLKETRAAQWRAQRC